MFLDFSKAFIREGPLKIFYLKRPVQQFCCYLMLIITNLITLFLSLLHSFVNQTRHGMFSQIPRVYFIWENVS